MASCDPRQTLDVLIVEDEILLAAELSHIVAEAGLTDVGHAMCYEEAVALADEAKPDVALVDVHLQDGPTGVEVARRIAEDCGGVVLFMTANVRRLPEDFAGACGVIGKPYSEQAVCRALTYLHHCLADGVAPGPPPLGFQLAPAYAQRWGVSPCAAA